MHDKTDCQARSCDKMACVCVLQVPAWLEPSASPEQAQAAQQLVHAALNCSTPPPKEANALAALGPAASSCLQVVLTATLQLLHGQEESELVSADDAVTAVAWHSPASETAADSSGRALAVLEALMRTPQASSSPGHSLLRSVLLLQALWPLTGRLVY